MKMSTLLGITFLCSNIKGINSTLQEDIDLSDIFSFFITTPLLLSTRPIRMMQTLLGLFLSSPLLLRFTYTVFVIRLLTVDELV